MNENLMVLQVRFVYLVRKIRTLGIGITIAALVIYFFGLLVAGSNYREGFEAVNLWSLIALILALPLTIALKKMMMRKVKLNNFQTAYFSAHIIPFAIIDFFALFCLSTNLLVNGNAVYATIAACVTLAGMILLFPKEEDFEKLKQDVTQA
jgi:hypothetical protein